MKKTRSWRHPRQTSTASVAGSADAKSDGAESITRQHAGVDEGGIASCTAIIWSCSPRPPVHSGHGGGALKPISAVERLWTGHRSAQHLVRRDVGIKPTRPVIGYSYERGGHRSRIVHIATTEISVPPYFHLRFKTIITHRATMPVA